MIACDDNKNILVTIHCTTYNHEPYMRQCLEGFVMQKTNFHFEAIVHDDASTDGTAAIIREYAERYPTIIKPIYETENQYSKHDDSILRTMYEYTHGKYIAICEGDDYWIDPLKLQKQVDFLENHLDYGLIHTKARVYYHNKGYYDKILIGADFEGIDQLLLANQIVTLTTCCRSALCFDYIKENIINFNWKMGDYPLWLYIAGHSKVHFMNETTAVYRVLDNSASHHVDLKENIAFILSAYEISSFFMNKYNKIDLHSKIKKCTLLNVYISYLKRDQSIDFHFLRLYKNFKIFSFKITIFIFLSYIGIIRSFLRRKWNLNVQ